MEPERKTQPSSAAAILIAAPFVAMAAVPIVIGAVIFAPAIAIFALLDDILEPDKG
jgi:hypothetical protein